MKLSELAQSRDNNFNLVRILAALAVLVSHSFPIALGTGAPEPLQERLGTTLGLIAVDVFFVTSGFLVTASLIARRSVVDFAWARVLRIFPALVVMLLLSVLVLGVFFTSLPLASYFSDGRTYAYFARGATLFFGVTYDLPGVFGSNPFRGAVNGSLWTLPYEVYMYSILGLVWLVSARLSGKKLDTFRLVTVALALVAGIYVLAQHVESRSAGGFERLFFMFFSGAAFHALRERVVLSRRVFWVFALALALSIGHKDAFFVVYAITIAYILLYLAYVPAGRIRKFNRLGDYSYGLYIYAFPVQQSVAALMSGASVVQVFAISACATFLLAALSWHLLERRALRLKERRGAPARQRLE